MRLLDIPSKQRSEITWRRQSISVCPPIRWSVSPMASQSVNPSVNRPRTRPYACWPTHLVGVQMVIPRPLDHIRDRLPASPEKYGWPFPSRRSFGGHCCHSAVRRPRWPDPANTSIRVGLRTLGQFDPRSAEGNLDEDHISQSAEAFSCLSVRCKRSIDRVKAGGLGS
jgi:hypothetical protein